MRKIFLAILFATFANSLFSQENSMKSKPQMLFLGAFDAGQPGANVYKMFDPTEGVVCYLLMPEIAARKQLTDGKWIYDGNSIGSISCLKTQHSASNNAKR